jgi:2-oxoglutarate dehydrogenase E2 component (dihydrolipoamide succinyltransferase)
LPSLGDSITEGTVVSWEVQEGQAVKPDDVLALVETDKVTVEIKATMEGVITNRFAAVYVEKKVRLSPAAG